MAPPAKPNVFEMRIALLDYRPEIWRRVLVPGSVRLDKLHLIFQDVMGWTNSHLHAFRMSGALYGMQFDDYPEDELDETKFAVASVIGPGDRFIYEYDFGDSWDHEVVIERVSRVRPVLKFAVCIDGANACPPEDVGGTGGYEELLEVLADPTHEDYKHYSSWAGREFDATKFDLAQVNAALQRLG
ncbi:MAG: plasmid pRiA4b ORF-3 family protein [Acidimicrobiales bacterium]